MVLPVAAARLMLGDASAEQPLRKALGDADEERRLEAIDFLVELDHPAATALLHKASTSGPDLASSYAEVALAAREGTDADVFERAYASPDRELRALAVRFAAEAATGGASRRQAKTAEKLVLQAFGDPDPGVRSAAARAAAALGLASATAPLTTLLADEIEPVRIEAAGALLAAP
jgi:HEAT repeat protein